ncbi:hypothetical protein AAVH_13951 [Aphelenchoides avenae]|nr:hypothetical protein AAVH_13951 [Aphelenchus avenae]
MMALPLGFALGAMLLRSERAGLALPAVLAVCAWIPVVNPLSTIYFIRAYRESIIYAMNACRPKRVSSVALPLTVVMDASAMATEGPTPRRETY